MLGKQGIQISAFTLKNYVPSGKRSATKGKTRKMKKMDDAVAESVEPEAPTAEDPPAKPTRGRRSSSTAKTTAPKSPRSRK